MLQHEQQGRDALMGAGCRGSWLAALLLLAGLFVTALATLNEKVHLDRIERRDFEVVCSEIQGKILERIRAHEQILRSGAAFYEFSENVDRQTWHDFTEGQKVEKQLPDIQGIGFSLLIPRASLAQHIDTIRNSGFPDYRVWPEGDREWYTSIIYLEPFTGRNLRAFGYDMLSEPVRRKAMERSRDADVAALCGKITLVQETDEDIQAGTLMYVPVYRNGEPRDTIEQRRAAHVGWVYSPYRMDDLMEGILGEWDLASDQRVRLEIFDGNEAVPESLLYDSQSTERRRAETPATLSRQIELVAAGHPWTLRITRDTQSGAAGDNSSVWFVLSGGIVISLLLSSLLYSALNTRFQAQQMALRLTAELRESEEKFRTVAEFTHDWEAWRNPDGTYRFVSPSCERITGHTAAEFMADHDLLMAITHPEDRPRLTAHHETVHREGCAAHEEFDFRICRPDGEIRWISHACLAVQGADGRALGQRESNRDITTRKRIEESLQDEHRRMEGVIEGTHAGTWEWNVQTGETVFNTVWAEYVGYTLEELAPINIQTWEALVHPDDRERSAELLARHFRGELPNYDCECRMRHKDGHWIWVHDRGRIITRTPDGEPLTMFGTHIDITERKRAELEKEALEAQNRQLQKSESLARMASAIAHHFNNHIQIISMSLEMAMEALPANPEKASRTLEHAISAATRASEVGHLMLAYIGQSPVRRERLDLCEVIRGALANLRAAMPENVTLTEVLPVAGPAVHGCETQLQQILENLVTNAWEANDGQPNTIDLSVSTVSASAIANLHRFPADWEPTHTSYACLTVADTGCGIAPRDIERLFDPFYTTRFTGRGMGLAVTLGVVRTHQGAITVESAVGTGSVFSVYLPLAAEAAEAAVGDAPAD